MDGAKLLLKLLVKKEKDRLLVLILNILSQLIMKHTLELKGDFTTKETQDIIIELIDGKADVVLSDAAPKLTGIKDIDNFRAYDLSMAVIEIIDNILKNNGNLIMKAFQGEAYQEIIKNLKKKFRNVKTTKPNSSRKRSAEMYVIARGFRGSKK